MEKINPVYLTSEEVQQLLKKEIGHGTDGSVFKYTKDYLIKLYHNSLKRINNPVTDDNNIKIYNGKVSTNNFSELLTYYHSDSEDVKLRSQSAIELIIDRQYKVKLTNLPKAPIYIDKRFSGYLIKKSKDI